MSEISYGEILYDALMEELQQGKILNYEPLPWFKLDPLEKECWQNASGRLISYYLKTQ